MILAKYSYGPLTVILLQHAVCIYEMIFADNRRIRCVNYDGASVSTVPFATSNRCQYLAYTDSNMYITDGTRYYLISDNVQQYVIPNVLLLILCHDICSKTKLSAPMPEITSLNC